MHYFLQRSRPTFQRERLAHHRPLPAFSERHFLSSVLRFVGVVYEEVQPHALPLLQHSRGVHLRRPHGHQLLARHRPSHSYDARPIRGAAAAHQPLFRLPRARPAVDCAQPELQACRVSDGLGGVVARLQLRHGMSSITKSQPLV